MSAVDDLRAELKDRLGVLATMSGPELEALAEAAVGEEILATAYAMRSRRGFLLTATDWGLRMSRRPKVFGRKRFEAWPWAEISDVRATAQSLDLTFGDEVVELRLVGPHDEFVRLVEAARRLGLGRDERPEVEELRSLARTKLGRFHAFGHESTIDAQPDRLLDGERVERLAIASLDFDGGLLVITDRRVILTTTGLRRSSDRWWEIDRSAIRGARADGSDLELDTEDETVTLRGIVPPDRLAELQAVLWRG